MGLLNILAKLFITLFFDSPNEYKPNHKDFHVRKFFVCMVTVSMISFNGYVLYGYFSLGKRYREVIIQKKSFCEVEKQKKNEISYCLPKTKK